MTLAPERSLHVTVPVPPPPGSDDGDAAPTPAPAAPAVEAAGSANPASAAVPAAGELAVAAFGDGAAGSALDVDEEELAPSGLTRPQTSRPPRPRPVQSPGSDEAVEEELRRQRLWTIGLTSGFTVISLAVLASWFV